MTNKDTATQDFSPIPQPRAGIDAIAPYQPGKSGSKSSDDHPIYKLSSNESALGPSPSAITTLKNTGENLHLYPNGSAEPLRKKIAALNNIDAEHIVCGTGSDELLQLLCQGYLSDGDNIVQSEHGFLVYALAAKSNGAQVRFAPEKNFTADVDALLKQIDEKTRLVFLANPNNPTGTYLPVNEIKRLHQGLRKDIILVLDHAYKEYMHAIDYDNGYDLVERNRNIVVTQTFSKIYGLGGLRLGWAYCAPNIARTLNKIRGPFNVSTLAQEAGIAALDDQDFIEANKKLNHTQRDILFQRLSGMGLECVPSHGNFLLVGFPQEPGTSAADIQKHLASNGVMVRDMTAYRLPDYLRISIGDEDATQRTIALLGEKFTSENE